MDALRSRIAWTFAAVFLISSLCADQEKESTRSPGPAPVRSKIETMSQKVDSMDKKVDQITEKNISGTLGGKNPPSRGCPGQFDFFTELSLLCWTSFNHGFFFAYELLEPKIAPSGIAATNATKHEVDFDYHLGTRFGMGYNSHFDAWDVEAIWTWFRAADDRFVRSSNFGLFNSEIGTFLGSGFYARAWGFWRLNYNTADLEVKRGFFLTKALSLKPILSIRAASLAQVYKFAFSSSNNPDIGDIKFKSHSLFWGIGPRIGVDAKWQFPQNFALTGLISGAFLYGKEKEKSVDSQQITTPPFEGTWDQVGQDHYRFYKVAPMVQMMLGLDWGICRKKDHIFFGLNASWELNYWWNQFFTEMFTLPREALALQGLTVKAELHF